jgi:glycosyltransferase involved in cell wall biosynthesis
MKRFYVSQQQGISGISKYSHDFYRLVLKERGYIYIDSARHYSEIFSAISSRDHVHIEIGVFQKKEIEILMRMIRAKYKNIAVTLHDAPLIKYPFYDFKIPLLNKASKFYDLHWDNFASLIPYAGKIKSIYVLSKKGAAAVKSKYHTSNVHYLPHIVDTAELKKPEALNKNFIFFGFIGPNKGIEYSLQLHEKLIQQGLSDLQFYVAGAPIGRQKRFYDTLRTRYSKNVHYLGYVPDESLNETFEQATIALLPFKEYGFFHPISGSILQSIKKGKLVVTNRVNTTSELIEEGRTGFFLSGNIQKDIQTLKNLLDNEETIRRVIEKGQNFLQQYHSPEVVKLMYRDIDFVLS